MALSCDRCGGRGWNRREGHVDGRDWPTPCAHCNGRGFFRTCSFARELGVNRRDIWLVSSLRAGSVVGARVLDAIVRRFPALLGEGG